jgi:kynureninase
MLMHTLSNCLARDAADPLRSLRGHFALSADLIYLDGNSLGALPRSAATRAAQVVEQEWGQGLIRSWNDAAWFDMPQRVGARIAPLIGAQPHEVVATDSTSVNLFKVLSAALAVAAADTPSKTVVLSERHNFPTDLYIAQSVCQTHGCTLELAEPDAIVTSLNSKVAVLLLTHVNYRTGAMHDMAAMTAAAHAAGALVVWDLAHSTGAVPVNLHGAGADFAVGCGYKFLNGGPGAPAFVWAHARYASRTDLPWMQPLTGWFGHAAPFAFTPEYQSAPGMARFLCGTPPVISMAVLDAALDVFDAAHTLGGTAALRAKSLALGDLFMDLVKQRCAGLGLGIATPRQHGRRGSQVSLTHHDPDAPHSAYAIVQALIARGVIGDFRAGDGAAQPDILRFGITPLYLGFADVWNAVEQLKQVLESGEWREARFARKAAVT